MDCFRTVLGSGGDNIRSAGLPLRHAWPWDAACPLPVALLIESVAEGDKWRNALLNKLQALPMWSDSARLKKQQDGRQDDKQIQLKERWQDALKVEKTRNENSHSHRLELLAIALRRELQSQRIPGLILPGLETEDRSAPKDKESRKSAVETLFVRVNSAGTDLGGEELIYSLLKSAWPQAPDEIKKLQPNKRQVISPARMVTFLARLCDAWENGSLSEKMPGTPSVRDFRKTMRSDVKRKELLAFVNKVEPVIKDLLELVLYARPREPNGHDHRLPPTLAAQLFSGERGLDILLILSVWLMRLHKGQDGKTRLTDISLDKRQRTLGFVVAVNWFAEDAGLCFRRLWPTLRKYPAKGIEDFFNKSQFQSLLTVEPDGKLVMLPLVHPATLERLIGDRVVNGCSNYPGPNNENYWVASGKWIHYYERIVPENYANLHSGIKDWLSTIPLNSPDAQADNNNAAARDERRRFAWFRFIEKLWGNRRVVDYAQREQLMHWFSDFDPTLPGQMDDVNRPWDYDHIHPQSMGSSSSIYNLPAVIREWHTSIGNLRAWPLELNRGDQNSVPARKLDEITLDTRRFQLDKNKKLRRASFVGETKDWLDWKRCVPDPLENNRYLLDEKNKEYRVALITAITTRFCRLYRHWYKSLALGKLT